MDTPTTPNTAYHVPAVGQLRPNIWGWWIGLTVLGGMIGEFFAAIINSRVWNSIDSIDNGFYTQSFAIVRYMTILPYGFVFGASIGLCQRLIYHRTLPEGASRSSRWLWIGSWMIIVLIEYFFRDSPFNDPWIIQSMVLGLVAGSIGGGIQVLILRRHVQHAVVWIASSGIGLMLGFAVFRVFVQNKLGDLFGIYDDSYYIGRLYQWAIYGVITGLTLEWLIRFTNKRRS